METVPPPPLASPHDVEGLRAHLLWWLNLKVACDGGTVTLRAERDQQSVGRTDSTPNINTLHTGTKVSRPPQAGFSSGSQQLGARRLPQERRDWKGARLPFPDQGHASKGLSGYSAGLGGAPFLGRFGHRPVLF